MIKEFKDFIARGNVLELAVGLILATYFGAIVKSLVNDIIMPPVGLIIAGVDFAELKFQIGERMGTTGAAEAVYINYGLFINTIITFVIVGFSVFLVVKSYNKFLKKEVKKEEAKPDVPSKEEVLLAEIRDLLAKK